MEYKLRLLNLKCYLSDEADGDEIYLKSAGKKIWPVEEEYIVTKGECTPIGLEFTINKGAVITYELWDYDILSSNDHLGSIILQADAHGHFINDFTKQGNDRSKYALEWEIG